MSERAAFLSAIRESPEDDTPRLVFADWLQEHGEDDRAEFVRLQIELAREQISLLRDHVRAHSDARTAGELAARPSRYSLLRARQRELTETHDCEWLAPLAPIVSRAIAARVAYGYEEPLPKFVRGFVGAVECEPVAWFECGDVALAAEPVYYVRLTSAPALEQKCVHVGKARALYHLAGRSVEVPLLARPAEVLAARWPGVRFAVAGDEALRVEVLRKRFRARRHADALGRVNVRPFRNHPAGDLQLASIAPTQAVGGWAVELVFTYSTRLYGVPAADEYGAADFNALTGDAPTCYEVEAAASVSAHRATRHFVVDETAPDEETAFRAANVRINDRHPAHAGYLVSAIDVAPLPGGEWQVSVSYQRKTAA